MYFKLKNFIIDHNFKNFVRLVYDVMKVYGPILFAIKHLTLCCPQILTSLNHEGIEYCIYSYKFSRNMLLKKDITSFEIRKIFHIIPAHDGTTGMTVSVQ